ncbi:MAG: hypothetical protein QM790_05425 [Nibricoccus sp.]
MNTTNPQKKKWFGNYRPFQPQPRIVPRDVTTIRFLKKSPYKITYADFTYAIQTVTDEQENISYIAARMLTATGRVHQPLHEYELSRRFSSTTGAEAAWSTGFETRSDYFLARTLTALLLEEEAAEKLAL